MSGYPYIRCRSRMQGHDWDPCGPEPGERRPLRGYVFAHFRCARCGLVKRYEIHRATGHVFAKPTYMHRPADYGTRPVSQAEWRRRLLAED